MPYTHRACETQIHVLVVMKHPFQPNKSLSLLSGLEWATLATSWNHTVLIYKMGVIPLPTTPGLPQGVNETSTRHLAQLFGETELVRPSFIP